MKCENAIKNINRYFKEETAALNDETREHLSNCPDCNMHFVAHEKADALVKSVRDHEPVLKNPSGLTHDILDALPERETIPEGNKKSRHIQLFQNIIFRWSLSAAAIILFALFGYEQFVVLDKINRLETQFQNVSEKKSGNKNMRTYKSWEIRAIKKFSSIRANKRGLLEKFNSVTNNI